MDAILLAGGVPTPESPLYPHTGGKPKAAVQIGGKSMIQWVLDALEKSPYADSTVIVLWSDHGQHLGEKKHWRKFALWENVLRTVLMIKAPPGTPGLPEGTTAGAACSRATRRSKKCCESRGLTDRPAVCGHGCIRVRSSRQGW